MGREIDVQDSIFEGQHKRESSMPQLRGNDFIIPESSVRGKAQTGRSSASGKNIVEGLPQADAAPTRHLESRRSCPPHRLGPDAISSHGIDDPLWHGGKVRRIGSLANP